MLDEYTIDQLRKLLNSDDYTVRFKAMGHMLMVLRKSLTAEQVKLIIKKNK